MQIKISNTSPHMLDMVYETSRRPRVRILSFRIPGQNCSNNASTMKEQKDV